MFTNIYLQFIKQTLKFIFEGLCGVTTSAEKFAIFTEWAMFMFKTAEEDVVLKMMTGSKLRHS